MWVSCEGLTGYISTLWSLEYLLEWSIAVMDQHSFKCNYKVKYINNNRLKYCSLYYICFRFFHHQSTSELKYSSKYHNVHAFIRCLPIILHISLCTRYQLRNIIILNVVKRISFQCTHGLTSLQRWEAIAGLHLENVAGKWVIAKKMLGGKLPICGSKPTGCRGFVGWIQSTKATKM